MAPNQLPKLMSAVALLGLSAAVQLPAWGQEAIAAAEAEQPARGEFAAPDLFVQIAMIQADIEQLRFEMGKPTVKGLQVKISNSTPQSVRSQALTLLEKSERFAYEQTRERADAQKRLAATGIAEVLALARAQIRLVKIKLNIFDAVEPPVRDPSKTSDDVFSAIIAANRQLNVLLDREFSPSDVYQQITVAIGYAARLLAQFPEATRLPDPAAFERGKRPVDVYRRLISCYLKVRSIARQSGLQTPDLEVADELLELAEPSDVYDMASLVISELAFLHARIPDAATPRTAYYPGRKFPSHVFQRVSILEAQLNDLDERVQQDANWLKR